VRVLPLSGLGLMLGVDRLMSTALAVHQHDRQLRSCARHCEVGRCIRPRKFDAYLAAQRTGSAPLVGLILLVPLPVSLSVGLRLNDTATASTLSKIAMAWDPGRRQERDSALFGVE